MFGKAALFGGLQVGMQNIGTGQRRGGVARLPPATGLRGIFSIIVRPGI